MPATGAIPAFGTVLQVNANFDGSGAWTTVAEIQDIEAPNVKVTFKEVTTMVSPNAYMEFVPTVKDANSVTFNVNYIPTNATIKNASPGLRWLQLNAKLWTFRIVYSDTGASVDQFTAYVESVKISAKVKDQLQGAIALKLSGAPTLV